MNARVQTLPKIPPHSIEPEQNILGALMVRQDCATQVFGIVRPEDFYRTDHRTIATAIQVLHEHRRAHDFLSVTETLRDSGTLEQAGGASYIGTLATDCSLSSLESHAQIVRDKSQRREVIALCASVVDAAYGREAYDLAGMLSAGVETLLRGSGVRSRKFAELIGPTEDYLKLAAERRRAGGHLGATCGLPAIDEILGGFYGSRLYGIAARPGTGKTALLNQLAIHAARRGHPGFVASLEMGAEELMIRALSADSKQNVTKLFHGYEFEGVKAMEAGRGMGDLPLWLDTESYGLNAILAQIAVHKHRHGIKWAAIDHVGLIQTEKFSSRNDQIGHITGALKRCAKQLGIPIIALLQLSRASEKEGVRPALHDLRDSGNIEQDLDVALFLHVDKADRDKPVRRVHVGVLKNRSGRSCWLADYFEFDGAVQTFRQIDDTYAPQPYNEPDGVPL